MLIKFNFRLETNKTNEKQAKYSIIIKDIDNNGFIPA